MAIYRESRPKKRKGLLAVTIVGAVTIVAIAAVFAVASIWRGTIPLSDSGQANSNALDKIATSLDLFQIEYTKISARTAAAQTGAPGAIDTALSALNNVTSKTLDATALAKLSADLNNLKSALAINPPPDTTQLQVDAQTQLQLLYATNRSTTAATPP